MLDPLLAETEVRLMRALAAYTPRLATTDLGTVRHVGRGVALVDGLPGVQAQELVRLAGGVMGLAFNLDPDQVGVVLLGPSERVSAGGRVRRTGRVADVPVGDPLLGRVLDALGQPLDGLGPLPARQRLPIERDAPAILDRAPVTVPLHTGIKVIDATVPIGRGQRQLILGDRQTGKTTLALDTILGQRGEEVIAVYCAIGQRGSAVARMVETLRARRALAHSVVVVAQAQDPPGLQFITPYAATSIAEHYMQRGRDVLIVYDDLTRHARAYRELSLLLRRPPGREAYPGDIFYIHSRLLERSTQLRPERGGGSLTALPIVETEAENLSAYVPTNLISITDGQIYLSPGLFHKGHLPAVDVGRSVSRVGGKAQLPAFRAVAGPLKLFYAQFEELEIFSRFGTRLDEGTRRTLERGRRVREVLKQEEHDALPPAVQIAVLLGAIEGLYDNLPLQHMAAAERVVRRAAGERLGDLAARIERGERLDAPQKAAILELVRQALAES